MLASALVLALCPVDAQREFRVRSAAELAAVVPQLLPGDRVLLGPGAFSVGSLRLRKLRGRPDAWITFRSEHGGTTVLGDGLDHVVTLDGCDYLRFEDLEFTAPRRAATIDAVRLFGYDSSHITFDRCRFHGVSGNGLTSIATIVRHLEVLDCEIDDCGVSGLSLGSLSGYERVENTVVRGCYIHELSVTARYAYGIHHKPWSSGAIIEDNVLHDVGGTEGAAIAVYFVDAAGGVDRSRWNAVRRNAVWSCRNEGIYAVNSAYLEDNVVIDARIGIAVDVYKGQAIDNLAVRNNTAYRCSGIGLRLAQLDRSGPDCRFANNVGIADNGLAVGVGIQIPDGLGRTVAAGNAFYDTLTQTPLPGFSWAAAAAIEFRHAGPLVPVGQLDLRPSPSGSLRGGGDPRSASPRDFDGRPRASNDVGAYQVDSVGPWRIQPGFKPSAQSLVPHFQSASVARGAVLPLWYRSPVAGEPFLILASAAGVWRPGPIPLAPDAWTWAALQPGSTFVGYAGVTTANGAVAALIVPPVAVPSPIVLYHAAVGLRNGSLELSNVARVRLTRAP